MTTQEFVKWFSKVDGIVISKYDADRLYFYVTEEKLIVKITKSADSTDNFLSLHADENKILFCLHRHKLKEFMNHFIGKNDLGIPDLSIVTVRQMIEELTTRENISFAFVMYDHSLPNNMTLEASGNPTFICGLLARATSLAAKYADKDINYKITDDSDPTE
jgi:hypothetical protein